MTVKKLTCLVASFLVLISAGIAEDRISEKTNTSSIQYKAELIYKKLHCDTGTLAFTPFLHAFKGFQKTHDSLSLNLRYLVVIDFTKPSFEKRLSLIDMTDTTIVHHDYVAHGKNSGTVMAQHFSNIPSSYQSSLGFYLTAGHYFGKHGLSLRLEGLDFGYNDKAHERAIVMHAADYAEPEFIRTYGKLGRSFGCPSMPYEGFEKVSKLLETNSLLFIYYPDENYLKDSVWLH